MKVFGKLLLFYLIVAGATILAVIGITAIGGALDFWHAS